MDDDYNFTDRECPKCGAYDVRSRDCTEFVCDDGWCDEYEDDPINFSPGEVLTMCHECLGTGTVQWCAKCGCDVTRHDYQQRCKTGVTEE